MRKYPKCFKKQVEMAKVNRQVIDRWISKELNRLLPDDDIVVEYTMELLNEEKPEIKSIQKQLAGFLEEDCSPFCKSLWELLLSAQDDIDGIPAQLIEEHKKIIEEKEKEKGSKAERKIPNHRKRPLEDKRGERENTRNGLSEPRKRAYRR